MGEITMLKGRGQEWLLLGLFLLYSTFQKKAAQEGIQDLPVVFKWR